MWDSGISLRILISPSSAEQFCQRNTCKKINIVNATPCTFEIRTVKLSVGTSKGASEADGSILGLQRATCLNWPLTITLS